MSLFTQRLLNLYDKLQNATQAAQQIPDLKFKRNWLVQLQPSWGGVTARFIKKGNAKVSVACCFQDFKDNFGNKPHWNILMQIVAICFVLP